MRNTLTGRMREFGGLFLIVPIFFSIFAEPLSIQHIPAHVYRRDAIPDPFTPHDSPFNLYAMGDSYTAGPGAGGLDPSNSGDCVRSVGSYGPQLQNDWIYTGASQLTFLACTGAITDDVLNTQIPEISSDPPPDLVLITIGGNDIGFSKIAKSCLVGLIGSGNCDDIIQEARDTFNSDAFLNKVNQVYDGIFDQMPKDFHYQVMQIGYSKFFNADDESTWCNTQSLGKVPFSLSPPKLTLELRRKLNALSDEFNSKLYAHLLGYANDKLNQPDREGEGWLIQRIWFADYDGVRTSLFAGHKFCEPGVENSNFEDPSTWIFGVWGDQKDSTAATASSSSNSNSPATASDFANIDASSCTSDPKYNDDEVFAWDCDMAVYYASPGADQTATTITGFDFVRSFHPKTAGFEAIKTYLARKILAIRRVPPIAQCIPAPGPDLDDISSTSTGFPSSLCATATGVSGYANSLSASATSVSPSATSVSPSESATSTSTAPAPTGTCNSQCDCNEDGCTSDSPGCCGNGTCDNSC